MIFTRFPKQVAALLEDLRAAGDPGTGGGKSRPQQALAFASSGPGLKKNIRVALVAGLLVSSCVRSAVAVNPLNIFYFNTDKSQIERGASVTLSWDSDGADACAIQPDLGDVDTQGEVTVSPLAPTTYTLTCRAEDGTQAGLVETKTLNIDVVDPVGITSFNVTPESVQQGDSAQISWQAVHASECTLDNGIGVVADSGSVAVQAQQTTTYTLTCRGLVDGVATERGVLTVLPRPVSIEFFEVDSALIEAGRTATLSWQSADAVGCNLTIGDQEPISVAVGGERSVHPVTTTSYTLTCTGVTAFRASADVEITVVPPVAITRFDVDRNIVQLGESVVLTWTSQNATGCGINPGGIAVSATGTHLVFPTETTSYTLNCDGLAGTATQSVSVVVVPPVIIDSFSATAEVIEQGASATLSWRVHDASRCDISPGPAAVPFDGSLTVSPASTTTFHISCVGPAGDAALSVEISVIPVLVIRDFAVTPSVIETGETATLSWSTENVPSGRCQLTPDFGTVLMAGSQDVTPSQSTSYTLACQNSVARRTQQLVLRVVAPVAIQSFTSAADLIVEGASTTLQWVASNALSCSIDPGVGGPGLDLTGSVAVSPTVDTDYTLTCAGEVHQVSQVTHVGVVPPVRIDSLDAFPATIEIGASATISWLSRDAAGGCTLNPSIGAVPGNGSQSVSPASTTTYLLNCLGAIDQTTRAVQLSVLPLLEISQLSSDLSTVEPGDAVVVTWQSSNADSCSLSPGIGPVALSGSRTVHPAVSVTYTLSCDNAAVSKTRSLDLSVVDAVDIQLFKLNPATIELRQSSTLSWRVVGATQCTIGGLGPVALAASVVVAPSTTTDYTLSCDGILRPAQQTVQLQVTQPSGPARILSFLAAPGSATVQHQAQLSWQLAGAVETDLTLSALGPDLSAYAVPGLASYFVTPFPGSLNAFRPPAWYRLTMLNTASPLEYSESVWAGRAGGSLNNTWEEGVAVASTFDGGSYMTGTYYQAAVVAGASGTPVNLSGTYAESFLAHYAVDGVLDWAQSSQSDDFTFGKAVASCADGSAVWAGVFNKNLSLGQAGHSVAFSSNGINDTDVFLAHMARDGTLLWARQGADPTSAYDADVTGVACLTDGSIVAVGNYWTEITFADAASSIVLTSSSGHGLYVVRYAANGNLVWAHSYGDLDNQSEIVRAVAAAPDGSFIIAGYFGGQLTFTGVPTLTSLGSSDVFIARMDAAGNTVWAEQGGGAFTDRAHALAVAADGSIAVTGSFQGTANFGATALVSEGSDDVMTARLDANGTFLWAKGAGGSLTGDSESGRGLTLWPDGSVIVVGQYSSLLSFEPQTQRVGTAGGADIFVVKYAASDGAVHWKMRMGGTSSDSGNGIAVCADGSLLVAATVSGDVTVGLFLGSAKTLSSGAGFGGSDAMLVRVEVPNTKFVAVGYKSLQFEQDIYPLFSQRGCVACHGSTQSPDLTQSAAAVYNELVLSATPRVIANDPASSTLRTKPLDPAHAGSAQAQLGDPYDSTMTQWIVEGAKWLTP